MSRDIKFKAFVNNQLHGIGVYPVRNINFYPFTCQVEIDGELISFFDFDNLKLIQFTGLKDKHAEEICEGDILTSTEYPFQDDGKYNYHGVVEWGQDEAAYYLTKHLVNKNRRGISHGISEMLGQEDLTTFEIIGNIYENPELLEETA